MLKKIIISLLCIFMTLSHITPVQANEIESIETVESIDTIEEVIEEVEIVEEEIIEEEIIEEVIEEEISTYTNDQEFDSSNTLSEFTFNPETNTIISYSTNYAATKQIVIPVQINGYDVLHIGEYAFSARQIQSLSFEEGSKVETIGDYAFFNNLTLNGEIHFPESIKSIGLDSFKETKVKVMYFSSLRDEITFTQNSLTSLRTNTGGYYANGGVFEDINSYGTGDNIGIASSLNATFNTVGVETAMVFTNLVYNEEQALLIDPSTNTVLQYYASHDTTRTHVTIPEGIKHIAPYAFFYDESLESITFSNSLETIGDRCFYSSGIIVFDISNTMITHISDYMCYKMLSLETLIVPASLTTMDTYAFAYSTLVEIIGFEDTQIEEIGAFSFRSCTSLKSIQFPKGTIRIEESAFYYCEVLEDFIFPDSITYIGANTFAGNKLLTEITLPKELIELGRYAFNLCTNVTVINFNDCLEIIRYGAFRYMTSLTQLFDEQYPFPTTIHTLEAGIFENCMKINVSLSFPSLVTMGSPVANKGVFDSSGLTEVILSNPNLTEVTSYAFARMIYLTNVTLPTSVETIGYYAFNACTKLEGIHYIDENNTIELNANRLPTSMTEVPQYMFKDCMKLPSFNLHDGITKIDTQAFYNCALLDELHIPSSVVEISSNALSNTKANGRIYIDKPYGSIEEGPWGAPSSSWIIWNGMEIGGYYLEDNTLSYELLLFVNEDEAYVSNYRLYDTSLYIPHLIEDVNDRSILYKIVKIDDYAFMNSVVEDVYIESGIKEIGDKVFYSNQKLKTVVIEDGIEVIGESLFGNCSSLLSVEFGEGLVELPDMTFYNNNNLESVLFPTTLNYVSATAFVEYSNSYFKNLKELVFHSEVEFGGSKSLPKSLEKLYLNAYYSDNPYEDLSGLGFNEKECSIYYIDTIEVSLDDCDVLFNINTNEYHKLLITDTTNSDVSLVSEFEYEGVVYTPTSLNDYFLVDNQTVVQYLRIPNEIVELKPNALYQSNDTGLQRVYIDHEVDGIEQAPWGRTYPLFRIIWSGSLEANEFYYTLDEDNNASIYMYLGQQQNIDLNDFNDWVNEKNLEKVSFSSFVPIQYNIVYLEDYLFYKNEFVEELTLSGSIEELGMYSFSEMSNLTNVYYNEGLLHIDDYAFYNSQKLEEVIFPESLNTIGEYVFYECDSIVVLQLPREMDPMNAIGINAISNCDSIVELRLPDNLEVIPTYFAMNLKSLRYMSIPYSVHTIGYSFVRGTTYNLYECVIEFVDRFESEPIQNESWKSYLQLTTLVKFRGAILYKDRTYQEGFLYSHAQEKVLSYHYQDHRFDSIEIPMSFDDREEYDDVIFNNYPKHLDNYLLSANVYSALVYTTIIIPDTIETIGIEAFRSAKIYDITIPSKVTSIGTGAFYNCVNLGSVVLPANLTKVSSSLFRGCTSLSFVSFSEGITSIDSDAFYGTALVTVNIPNSVSVIGSRAFAYCHQLEAVHIGTNASEIYDIYISTTESLRPFYDTPKLNNLVIGGTRGMLSNEVAAQSPWGGDYNNVFTFYWGEFVYFEHYVVRHDNYEDDVKYYINLWAECQENFIQEIHFPIQDYNVASIGAHTWYSEAIPYVYEVEEYGSYRFEGFDNSGFDSSNVFYVFFEEREIPQVDAVDIYIRPSEVLGISEAEIIDLSKAVGKTYDGNKLEPFLSYNSHLSVDNILVDSEQTGSHIIESIEDIWKLSSGEVGDFVTVNVTVKDNRYNTYDVKEVDIILIDEGTPIVYGEHVSIKEDIAASMTVEQLLDLANSYATSYDGTRKLDVALEDEMTSIEVIQSMNADERYRVTLSTYDEVMDRSGYTQIDIRVLNQGIPLIEGDNIYIKEVDLPYLTTDLITELSNPQATCYQGVRELEYTMLYEDLVGNEVLNLNAGDVYAVKYKTYDPIEDESATTTIYIHVIEGYDPFVYADNIDIHVDDLYLYEGDSKDVFNLVMNEANAYATNYDGSRDLEVLMNDSTFDDFTSILYEHTYLAVSLATEDLVEGTTANTVFMVHLTDEERIVPEEEKEEDQDEEVKENEDIEEEDVLVEDNIVTTNPYTGDDNYIVGLYIYFIISLLSILKLRNKNKDIR